MSTPFVFSNNYSYISQLGSQAVNIKNDTHVFKDLYLVLASYIILLSILLL